MPINVAQLQEQVKGMTQQAQQTQCQKISQLQKAVEALRSLDGRNDWVMERLARIGNRIKRERFAFPYQEGLSQIFASPSCLQPSVRVGTDGSQISPSKDNPYDYALVNLGAIIFRPQVVAQQVSITKLLLGEAMYEDGEHIDSDYVEVLRDFEERALLLEAADDDPFPVIGFIDGPLELYRQPAKQLSKRRLFHRYLKVLKELEAKRMIVGGYIDAPEARLILRLLELLHDDEHFDFSLLRDTDLFAVLLKQGERSSVFRLNSRSTHFYTGGIELFGFYVNVSKDDSPVIGRVEIPRYIAENQEKLDLFHAILVQDSRIIEYPLALYRAHEIAKVSSEEKAEIEAYLIAVLWKLGIPPRPISRKSQLKGLK